MAKDDILRQPLVAGHDSDDTDEDIEVAKPTWEKETERRADRPRSLYRYLGLGFSFLFVSLVSLYAGTHIRLPGALDKQCTERMSKWSPIHRDVPVEYSDRTFEGSFMNENIYRRQGSPEVDEAWDALGVGYRAGAISYEDGIKSGLNDSFVQRADTYGGGFFVNVEGFHHLHCLNLVRKGLYFNVDYYKELRQDAFKNEEMILRLHITHCLDMVRQRLLCQPDLGMLGQVWVYPGNPVAFPFFNSQNNKCVNWEPIRQWAEKIQAPEDPYDDYLKSPTGYIYDATP